MELADRPCEAFDPPAQRAKLRAQVLQLQPLEQHAAQFVAGAEELGRSLGNTGLDPHYVRALLSEEEATRLNVDDTFLQLGDFAENLQHQVQSLVVEPLREYGANLAEARRQAAKFDDESAELDAATLKYLSLSRESPLETRAVAQQDLSDRVAQTALQLFDTQMALKDGCGSQRCVPQRALGELLVAQLAYHQSCTRLLSGIMPQVSALLEEAEERRRAIKEEQPADARLRSFLPRPQLRDEGSTLAEGWLLKGTFSLASDMNAVQGHLNRMKTMNKRWFVLCTDGKLYYYKSPEDAKTAKVPIDMNLVASVGAVNGPLEFELRVGARALRLKAESPAERERWMGALSAYLASHEEERAAAAAVNLERFVPQGRGVRDLDMTGSPSGGAGAETRLELSGWVHRSEGGRWRKWWCDVDDGVLTLSLYETLRICERPAGVQRMPSSTRGGGRSTPDPSQQPPAKYDPARGAYRSTTKGEALDAAAPPPFRTAQVSSVPLSTATVREARGMSAPFCFELISPQGSILLQALSQEEVSLWTSVIQNNTARLLGTHMERRASIDLVDTPLGAVRGAAGNRHCADCGADDPTWASINLGVVLCTRCAGAHRQLGVHISKVRSLDLDVKEWSEPLLALMKGLGNECQNRVWQAQLPASQRLASADVDERRRLFVTQKWASRAFVVPPDLRDAAAPHALHAAAAADDVAAAAACLAYGDAVDAPLPDADAAAAAGGADASMAPRRTAAHVAAAEGSLATLELLLQNGASVDAVDADGRTPLHLAVVAGEGGAVAQLLTRRANISQPDGGGQTPMGLAAAAGADDLHGAMLAHKLAEDEKIMRQQVDMGD